MVKRSRILGLVMAAVLSGTLLAGCGSKDETTTAGGQPNTAAPAAEAPGKAVKIDIIEPGNGLPSPDQDIIKQELDSKLGTDLNLTVYASGDDYKNQLNVRMASANFPDLFTVDRLQLKQFSEQGLLLDLSDYLEKLKPTIDFIGEDSLKKGMFNDRVYAIAKSPQIPYNTYWVRKDWLDKLGLQPPKTLDDLYTVAKAFTDQDPDGNGKKDTFGMTGAKLGTFSSVFGAYGIGFDGSPTMYIRDNKLVNSLHDPGMKDALTFIRKLVDAGAVDPELMANSGLQHQEKAIKGQAGIIYIDWPNMTKDQFTEQIKAVNPDAEWIQIEAPEGPGGKFASAWDVGMTPALYAIPKALEKNPEKLDKVIELLNYVSTDGSNLVQYGVEGKHYNIEGDTVVPTELLGKEGAYFWLYQFTGRPEKDYLSVKFAPQKAFVDFAANQPHIETYGGFIDFPDNYNAADATRYIEEELTKFVYGKRPIEEYDAFLNTLDTSMNYKMYIDSAQEQLAKLGFLK